VAIETQGCAAAPGRLRFTLGYAPPPPFGGYTAAILFPRGNE